MGGESGGAGGVVSVRDVEEVEVSSACARPRQVVGSLQIEQSKNF